MAGHLYYEYGSETLRGRAVVADIPERAEFKDGGRGYYRNVSLLNVWATAPFMHNNAIGPELCGKPKNQENDFFRARYVDANPASSSIRSRRACATTPSVDGRFELYKKSMHELLNPQRARHQDDAHRLRHHRRRRHPHLGRQAGKGAHRLRRRCDAERHFRRLLGGLLHKEFIGDLYLRQARPGAARGGRQEGARSRAAGIADDLSRTRGASSTS